MSRKDIPPKEIPDILHDLSTGKRYQKGRFLGKGGFAKCYEITDLDTKQVFAGKIVPKVSLILCKRYLRPTCPVIYGTLSSNYMVPLPYQCIDNLCH